MEGICGSMVSERSSTGRNSKSEGSWKSATSKSFCPTLGFAGSINAMVRVDQPEPSSGERWRTLAGLTEPTLRGTSATPPRSPMGSNTSISNNHPVSPGMVNTTLKGNLPSTGVMSSGLSTGAPWEPWSGPMSMMGRTVISTLVRRSLDVSSRTSMSKGVYSATRLSWANTFTRIPPNSVAADPTIISSEVGGVEGWGSSSLSLQPPANTTASIPHANANFEWIFIEISLILECEKRLGRDMPANTSHSGRMERGSRIHGIGLHEIQRTMRRLRFRKLKRLGIQTDRCQNRGGNLDLGAVGLVFMGFVGL